MLTRGERFVQAANFITLNQVYDVTGLDIENRIKTALNELKM